MVLVVRGEGRPLYLYIIMPVCILVVHTSVFSFTRLTATNVLCSSIKDCFKLEITQTNYHGILKIHQENQGILLA